MNDLVEFLLARIACDEAKIEHMQREAVRVETAPIFGGLPADWLGGVDIFVSPDRWRAECEAKRRIVQEWGPFETYNGEALLRLLALPYADHPDWRAEWRP